MSPGSPGPAPIRYTVARVTAESPGPLACARCASARMSPAPSASSCAPTRAPIAAASSVPAASRAVDGAAAVERHDHGDELELIVRERRGQRSNRRLASASQRFDDRTFRIERRMGLRLVDRMRPPRRLVASFSRISIATMPCPGAGTQADGGRVAEIRDAMPRRRSPAAASTMRVIPSRGRRHRACAVACRGCRGWA